MSYRNTKSIHKKISDFKNNILTILLNRIKINLYTTNIKFKSYNNILNLYDRLKKISDWPFNPRSFKNIGAFFTPLVIEILGTNIIALFF